MKNKKLDIFYRLYIEDYSVMTDIVNRSTKTMIWKNTPDGVSLANIICHVCEMERYWIDAGICREKYNRDRDIEFIRSNDYSIDELLEIISRRKEKTFKIINNPDEYSLDDFRDIHNEQMTGFGILHWHSHHLGLHRGHMQAHERWLRCQEEL